MFVSHREFTTAAEIHANHVLLRNKFFPPMPKAQSKADPRRIDPEKRGKRPLWSLLKMHFDAHVKLRKAVLEREAPAAPVEPKEKPLWTTNTISFNSHVVEYRRYLLVCEEGDTPVFLPKKPMDEIVGEVLRFFPQYGLASIKGRCRNKGVILPRHLAVYEVHRQRPDQSYPQLAKYFCRNDHSGLIYAVNKIHAMKEAGDLSWFYGGGKRD